MKLSASLGARFSHALIPSYRRRTPEETVLYQVLAKHLETFLGGMVQDDSRAGLPGFVEQELRGFLDCGILAKGFARVHCLACGRDSLVAFSCKKRGFCPSCGGRRMADTAARSPSSSALEDLLTSTSIFTSWFWMGCTRKPVRNPNRAFTLCLLPRRKTLRNSSRQSGPASCGAFEKEGFHPPHPAKPTTFSNRVTPLPFKERSLSAQKGEPGSPAWARGGSESISRRIKNIALR